MSDQISVPLLDLKAQYATIKDEILPAVEAVLEGPLSHKGNRRSYLPVRLRLENGRWLARPLEYHGSADIIGFSKGNAVAAVPEGVRRLDAGDRTLALPLGGAIPDG